MTLQEFIAEEVRRVERFAQMWRRENKTHGDEIYPMEMPPGEWDEQLLAFADEGDPS